PTKSFNLAGLSGTAWCVIPDPVKRAQYQAALQAAKLNEAAVPSLVATIAAYTHEPLWLNDLKKYLEGNITFLEKRMESSPDTRGIRVVRPQASFLLWLDCRALGLPQEALMALFNEKAGVVVNNGASYGTGGAGFVRLNIGCPRSVVEEALDRIARAVAALKR
ncbi:MAG: aminotransferase class I/II-fold pyridoxal phosphate-dependent enzyme, partial [Bacteroidales bacterium]|nr:aminotransferase class I/II-fold pyridoxal phosphate-dependent enzyme [Bacteroidales bacterium]